MAALPVSLRSAYVGLGFALGFGWLWFPALQARWLPEMLWGTSYYGGGALFLALLFAGFTVFCFAAGRIAACKAKLGRLHPAHAVHGASLVLLAAAILLPGSASGLALYAPVLLMAALGMCLGIYWGGTLLSLPPQESLTALLTAALAQVGLVFLFQATPANWNHALMLASVAAAWMADRQLIRLERNRTEEARRPRGRPPKIKEEAPSTHHARHVLLAPVVIGVAFAVLIAGETALPPPASAPVLGIAVLTACGAAFGFILCLFGSPRRLLSLPVALAGLVMIFFPDTEWSWMPLLAAEAAFCLLALAMLNQPDIPHTAMPAQRAARYLGVVLILSFLANALPDALMALQMPGITVLPSGILLLLLAALPFIPFKRNRAAEPAEVEEKNCVSCLTSRESDILRCLKDSMDDAQIAAHLGIKETTVRYHLANMFKKTGYTTRAKLAAFDQTMPVGTALK